MVLSKYMIVKNGVCFFMITFNPGISTSSKLKRTDAQTQSKINFQRGFEAKELRRLTETSSATFNDVMVFIGAGVIRAQDGAVAQIKALDGKIHERWYRKITEALGKSS